MTDRYWNESSDAARMLDYVLGRRDHRDGGRMVSDRRLRLFACACARQAWHLLTDERSRRAVEVAERYADGETDKDAIIGECCYFGGLGRHSRGGHVFMAWTCCASDMTNEMGNNWREATQVAGLSPATQANLLRDIIGNPFQPIIINEGQHTLTTTRGIVLDRRWLTPTVVALATAAYEERGRVCGRCSGRGEFYIVKIEPVSKTKPSGERVYPMMRKEAEVKKCPDCHGTGRVENGQLDNDRLAVLADALELDAGCPETTECPECEGVGSRRGKGTRRTGDSSAEIVEGLWACMGCCGRGVVPSPLLAHLRSEGPHVRGCWVIDALLGKA